jgi:hypothetical protein
MIKNNTELQDLTGVLTKPYIVTRSKLGTTTKLIDEIFVCSPKELQILFESVGEKIASFNPTKAGFQYLISFTDSTHYENNDLSLLSAKLSSSDKSTDKLILNWSIGHEFDGIENEMSITIRISNPMNPFVMLQAIMSRNHMEADQLDFENGSVSISINGATQNTAEELFSIVNRWAKACPQPQSITELNKVIYKHTEKLSFLNYWVFPVLYIACAFFYLKGLPVDTIQAYSFVAFALFLLIRSGAKKINDKIERWSVTSRRFSLFMVTGGDANQQTKIAAKSKNNTIKLVGSVFLSFVVNIAAGYIVATYLTS